MDILSTSGINNLIYSYKNAEQNKRISPLQSKLSKYNNLSTAWSTLSSKLTSLNSVLSDLKVSTSSSIFNSRTAELSDSSFFGATASKNATPSSYTMRVNQLAKSDLIVSDTMASSTAVSSMAGSHKIKIQSGDYVSYAELTLTSSETNSSIMDAISDAINNDYAVLTSAELNGSTTYNGSGSFKIDVNGTETTIDYDYSAGFTYTEVVDDLVSQINSNVDGVTAEKVTDGSNVSLKITVNDKSQYISMEADEDTGTLLNSSNLNIDITKEKSASALATGSVFTPTSGNSKLSITAENSGYDNRLILSDESGSALNFVGLDSTLLTNRTVTTTDTDAGFMYDSTSATSNGLNSVIEFNGIGVQRNSNTIDDLVTNVTFELTSKMESTDATVNVAVKNNTDEIKGKINDFISKFNDAYLTIKNNYFSGKDGRGVFVGDTTALSLMRTLQNTVISKVSGLSDNAYSYLSQVGITFDPSTGLTLSDSSKLETAIQNEPAQLADLFTSNSGMAVSLYNTLDAYVGADGSITDISSSISNNISYLNNKIDYIQTSIDKSAENLRKQYERLQMQYASLLNQQSFYSSLSGGMF